MAINDKYGGIKGIDDIDTRSIDKELDKGSDFDDFDIGLEIPDDKRKPVTQFARGVKDAAKDFVVSVPDVSRDISKALPETHRLYEEATGIVSDISRIRDEAVKDLAPTINALKQTSRRIMPKIEGILPKKIYDKVYDKLAPKEDTRAADTVGEARNVEVTSTLKAIFEAQQAQQQEDKSKDQADKYVEQAIMRSGQRDTSALLGGIHQDTTSLMRFSQTAVKGYMMKSLELKYKHLFIAQDTFGITKLMAESLETKLSSIAHNTALPDIQKKRSLEALKEYNQQLLIGKAASTVGDWTSGLRQNVMNRLGKLIKEKTGSLKDSITGLVDMTDMYLDASESAAEMGMQSSPLEGAGRMAGSAALTKGMAIVMSKMFSKLKDSGIDIDNFAESFRSNLPLMINEAIQNADSGFLKFLADAELIPPLLRERGDIAKTLEKGALEEVPFDMLTRQSIIEIIPGYLSKIHQAVSTMAKGEHQDELVYDIKTQDFVTKSKFKKALKEKYFGTRASRTAEVQESIGELLGAFSARGGETEVFYDSMGDIVKFFNNAAKHALPIDPEVIRNIKEGKDIPDSYKQWAFKDIKDKDALIDILYKALYKDGKVDVKTKQTLEKQVRRIGVSRDKTLVDQLARQAALGTRRFHEDIMDEEGKISHEKIRDIYADVDLERLKTLQSVGPISSEQQEAEETVSQRHERIRKIASDMDIEDMVTAPTPPMPPPGRNIEGFTPYANARLVQSKARLVRTPKAWPDSEYDPSTYKYLTKTPEQFVLQHIPTKEEMKDLPSNVPMPPPMTIPLPPKMTIPKPSPLSHGSTVPRPMLNIGSGKHQPNIEDTENKIQKVVSPELSMPENQNADMTVASIDVHARTERSPGITGIPMPRLSVPDPVEEALATQKTVQRIKDEMKASGNDLSDTPIKDVAHVSGPGVYLQGSDQEMHIPLDDPQSNYWKLLEDTIRRASMRGEDSVDTTDVVLAEIYSLLASTLPNIGYVGGGNGIIGRSIASMRGAMGSVMSKSTGFAKKFYGMSTDMLNKAIPSGIDIARKGAPVIGAGIGNLVGGSTSFIRDMLSGAGEIYKGAGKRIGSWLSPGGKPASDEPVDIYTAGSESGNPSMSAIDIAKGYFTLKDGTIIKKLSDITGPVFDIRTGNIVISATDLKNGLYDMTGEPIKATKNFIGKIVGGLWDKGKDLFGFGTGLLGNIPDMYKTIFDMTTKAGGTAIDMFRKVFNLDSGSGLGNEEIIQRLIADKLDSIYAILDERLLKPIAGDTDFDRDREGSYEDYKQEMEEKKAKLEQKRISTKQRRRSYREQAAGMIPGFLGGSIDSDRDGVPDALSEQLDKVSDDDGILDMVLGGGGGLAALSVLDEKIFGGRLGKISSRVKGWLPGGKKVAAEAAEVAAKKTAKSGGILSKILSKVGTSKGAISKTLAAASKSKGGRLALAGTGAFALWKALGLSDEEATVAAEEGPPVEELIGQRPGISEARESMGDLGETAGWGALATKVGKGVSDKVGVTKLLGKGLEKVGVKGAGKMLAKKIPFLGAIMSTGFATKYAMEGDWVGAALTLGSGLASTIPGIGTAASFALDGMLIGHELMADNINELVEEDPSIIARMKVYRISKSKAKIGLDLERWTIDRLDNQKPIDTDELRGWAGKFGFDPKDDKQMNYFFSWYRNVFVKGLTIFRTVSVQLFNKDIGSIDGLTKESTELLVKAFMKQCKEEITQHPSYLPDLQGYTGWNKLNEIKSIGKVLTKGDKGMEGVVPDKKSKSILSIDDKLVGKVRMLNIKQQIKTDPITLHRYKAYGIADQPKLHEAVQKLEHASEPYILNNRAPSRFALQHWSKMFGFDSNDEKSVDYFAMWYRNRFMPAYKLSYKLSDNYNTDMDNIKHFDYKIQDEYLDDFITNVNNFNIPDIVPTKEGYKKYSDPLYSESRDKKLSIEKTVKFGEKDNVIDFYQKRSSYTKDSGTIHGTKTTPSGVYQGDINKAKLGTVSGREESGKAGSYAIGYDRTGGTSYGKYQLASRGGASSTFNKFLDWAETQPGGAEVVERLRAAGDPNTFGRGGSVPEEWKKLVKEGRLSDLEHAFIKHSHYDPALKGIKNKELKDKINRSRVLQEALWSTAVQHGSSMASKIFDRSYEEGMSDIELIEAVYNRRGTKFPSSTKQVQASVKKRFARESAHLIALAEKQNAMVNSVATPNVQELDPIVTNAIAKKEQQSAPVQTSIKPPSVNEEIAQAQVPIVSKEGVKVDVKVEPDTKQHELAGQQIGILEKIAQLISQLDDRFKVSFKDGTAFDELTASIKEQNEKPVNVTIPPPPRQAMASSGDHQGIDLRKKAS